IRQYTGVMALDEGLVTRALEQEAELPTGMAEVAEARLSVRRAMASITEDSENAQEYLWNANRTLTHALEGMRPDQGRETVAAAQESVQQASERVAAVAETAAKVDAEVTVYTTDGCPGCFATKRALDKAGVEYDEISLKEHPDLVAKFKRQLGKEGQNVTAPIVETKDGDIWSGYNPSKLKEHGLDHRTRQRRGKTNRDTGHGRCTSNSPGSSLCPSAPPDPPRATRSWPHSFASWSSPSSARYGTAGARAAPVAPRPAAGAGAAGPLSARAGTAASTPGPGSPET